MAEPPAKRTSKRGAGADTAATQRALLDAALFTVRERGYAGASARAIAGNAECNQASIYYHFGGITELLVAALIDSSERRFARYQEELDGVSDIGEILRRWRVLHQEDIESGHISVLVEILGALGAEPGLADGVRQVTTMWTDFINQMLERTIVGTPLAAMLPIDDVPTVIFALFLGIELLTHIDGQTARVEHLFDGATRLASVFGVAPTDPPRTEQS